MLVQRGVGVDRRLGAQGRFVAGPDAAAAPHARLGRGPAGLAPSLPPAADRPVGDAEGAGGLRLLQPGVQGAQQAVAEVGRVLFHPRRIAPGQLLCNAL
ncbi:MAG: hypothetical protein K0Q89_1422 [Thermomicrobiales bacterium]|nr:hypothetical protein [Thermomicrobiales bacterium]